MGNLYERLLDLVFPPRCPGCRARGVLLCAPCIERCRRLRNDPTTDEARQRGGRLLGTIAALYQYETPLREAIHLLKYRRRKAMAEPLGHLLIEALPGHVHHCDVVIPVPLHTSRVSERGFNQSELLAAAICAATGLPLQDGLRRVRATARQVGMDRRAREANVRGAFAWGGGTPPRSILLVDDVVTTGSTMRECARALRAAGAREIHGVALAGGY